MTPWLTTPGVWTSYYAELFNRLISIRSQIIPISHIDPYFFKIHFNDFLPSTLGHPCGPFFLVDVPVEMLKAITPSPKLATNPTELKLLELINLARILNDTAYKVPSCGSFSILIPIALMCSSLSAIDHFSQSYFWKGNILFLFLYLSFHINWIKFRRQFYFDWKITWISCFKSTFYLLINRITIS